MLLKTETQKYQSDLAAYCRKQEDREIPGLTAGRKQEYQRLIFNIFNDSLESSFPIANSYLDNGVWAKMVLDFFRNHNSQTPQLWKLAFEFYQFAVEQNYQEKFDLFYLNDLLLFEWMEIELYMMEDIPYPDYCTEGDWENDLLVFNPEFKLIQFTYPVHRVKPVDLDRNAGGNYFLLIFREKESGKVQFVNLSIIYAYVIEKVTQQQYPLQRMKADIVQLWGINDINYLDNQLKTFLKDMKEKGFLLGFSRK